VCVLQGQIQWAEVEKSKFLYDVNVSSATGRLYGVAVKHAGAHSGPVLWTSCLYDISQRLCCFYVMFFVSILPPVM